MVKKGQNLVNVIKECPPKCLTKCIAMDEGKINNFCKPLSSNKTNLIKNHTSKTPKSILIKNFNKCRLSYGNKTLTLGFNSLTDLKIMIY